MFYISLILIFIGLLLFIYSSFILPKVDNPLFTVEKQKIVIPAKNEEKESLKELPAEDIQEKDPSRAVKSVTPDLKEENIEKKPVEEPIKVSAKEIVEEPAKEVVEEPVKEVVAERIDPQKEISENKSDTIISVNTENIKPVENLSPSEGKNSSFILFEDKSGIINYSMGSGVIDSTVEGYKNIKRIGKGELKVIDEGVNFILGNKFFRYDFHKIKDFFIGENYIALRTENTDYIKLFISEKETGVIQDAEGNFLEYKANIKE